MTPGRWFGVGSSSSPDPITAATEATNAALVGPDPALTIVFASTSYDLPKLTSAIAALNPGVPMIGCTTAGEISSGRVNDHSVSVSILGGEIDVVTNVATNASDDLASAGTEAASASRLLPARDHQVLLLLTDGLSGDQAEVVRGAYAEVGAATRLVGGCAGDDSVMAKTFQIHDGQVYENAVVAASIGSDGPIGIGVRHGWRPVGEPMLVTGSSGTTVHQLNHEPAVDVYLERFGAASDLSHDADSLAHFAMTHPLGLRRTAGEEVRFISGADLDSRSLTSIAEIPQGSLVWAMEGDSESVLTGTSESCNEALTALGHHEPIGMLFFDCIARRNVLGAAGVNSEMAAIAGLAPSVPTSGFYTYGEIARTRGVRGFHNQTLVTLAFS